MIDKLSDYIHSQKKKGFKDKQIKGHLQRHGWHQSHIGQAYHALTKRHNQRFIAYSIWYILLVFIITVGLVQLGKYTAFATEGSAHCFGNMHGMNTFFDKSMCCKAIENLGCTQMSRPLVVRGAQGQPVFQGSIRCYNDPTTLYFTPENYRAC